MILRKAISLMPKKLYTSSHTDNILWQCVVYFVIVILAPQAASILTVLVGEHGSDDRFMFEGLGRWFVEFLLAFGYFIAAFMAGRTYRRQRLKQLDDHPRTLVVPVITAYLATIAFAYFGSALPRWQWLLAWPLLTIAIPVLIAYVSYRLSSKPTLSRVVAVVSGVILVGTIVGGTLPYANHMFATSAIGRYKSYGFTLYVPPQDYHWPQPILVGDLGDAKDIAKITLNDPYYPTVDTSSEHRVDIGYLTEMKRPVTLPATNCGKDYQATYLTLSRDTFSSFKCQLLETASAGRIYEMKYKVYNKANAYTHSEIEYFIVKDETVVYGTYTRTNVYGDDRYDQATSIKFLKSLQAVSGEELYKRIWGN